MTTNPFVEQRLRLETSDALASAVGTLPVELRNTNAAPLLNIARELEASSVIELGVITAITRLDPENAEGIRQQQWILHDYDDRRLYDRDRTHCSNISRILTQVSQHADGPGAEKRIKVVDDVLAPVAHADDILLDDIASILRKARIAIDAMATAGSVSEIERIQQEFAAEMEPIRQDIKASLRRINAFTAQLIDVI